MDKNKSKLLDWFNNGKYVSVFAYNHPSKVLERTITKCTGYVPGSHKQATNK